MLFKRIFRFNYIDIWCTEIDWNNTQTQGSPQFFRDVIVADTIFICDDKFVARNKFVKFIGVDCAQIVVSSQAKNRKNNN